MRTIQEWLVLVGICLNLSALGYAIYIGSVLYATIFLIVATYLVVVYRTGVGRSG